MGTPDSEFAGDGVPLVITHFLSDLGSSSVDDDPESLWCIDGCDSESSSCVSLLPRSCVSSSSPFDSLWLIPCFFNVCCCSSVPRAGWVLSVKEGVLEGVVGGVLIHLPFCF